MVKVKVKGLMLSVNERITKDFYFAEMLCELDGGNPLVFPKACKRLFGDEQTAKILDHIKDDDGICDIEVMVDFFTEAMEKIGASVKN